VLNGVLVQKDFNMSLVAPEDLREFAGLETNVVMQRQTVAYHGGLPLLKWHLDNMFGGLVLESRHDSKKPMFKVYNPFPSGNSRQVMDAVVLVFESQNEVSINWIGNSMNDTIADAVLCIILGVESSPSSLLGNLPPPIPHLTPVAMDQISPHAATPRQDRLQRVLIFLEAQFGDAMTPVEDGIEIRVDDNEAHMAKLDFATMEVECKWEPLESRVKHIVKRALSVVAPLSEGGVVNDLEGNLLTEMEDGIKEENGHDIKMEDED